MVTNPSTAKETIHQCALCGTDIVLYYASETAKINRFCSTAHKDEWHSIVPLSRSRLKMLETVENEPNVLPYNDTVMRLAWDVRTKPLIRLISNDNGLRTYEITDYGKLVLDRHRNT